MKRALYSSLFSAKDEYDDTYDDLGGTSLDETSLALKRGNPNRFEVGDASEEEDEDAIAQVFYSLSFIRMSVVF